MACRPKREDIEEDAVEMGHETNFPTLKEQKAQCIS